MRQPEFIPIGDVLVDSSILGLPFACDVERCRGACCTVPGSLGAPLLEEEVPVVESLVALLLPRLPAEAQRILQESGAVMQQERQFYTRCVGEGACVFVVWERGIARCAIEQAYEEGLSSFRKPLSCHLFPLRLRQRRGQRYLVAEPFEECAPAYDHGRRCGTTVVGSVGEALERAFGSRWCGQLQRVLIGMTAP
ncbi:MAG: DUF3109 family protein [Candidatus Kapabacteria bacterium]|nr:DUF3109 family protein [Candidatus Kapabacteria bacterium]MCS7170088.1 DUF3109 family protein [Candidatus Kapabacteria bacterium]MDW7997246.1 DUF3109 family protein [Bacteroidota bacterium]MDW8225743.1 DUF3109 family protein [Bacteroidota bacterium]